MSTKPWPTNKVIIVDGFAGSQWGWELEPKEPTTACKHGHDECELCGTTNRRDALHTTVGGRGLFSRLTRGK